MQHVHLSHTAYAHIQPHARTQEQQLLFAVGFIYLRLASLSPNELSLASPINLEFNEFGSQLYCVKVLNKAHLHHYDSSLWLTTMTHNDIV